MEEKTVFGRIIDGELPCEKVYETEDVLAFKDIQPVAPIHVLIIPKKPIKDIQSVANEDMHYLPKIFAAAQHIAKELGVEDAYRLLTNNGSKAGQTVFHLHFHLIAGRELKELG